MAGNSEPMVLLLGGPRMLRDVIAFYIRTTAPDLHIIDADRFSFDSHQDSERTAISLIAFIDTSHDPAVLLDEVRKVRDAFPGPAIAIISDCHDAEVVTAAVEAGIRGYVSMNTSGAVLSHAFRILLNGGEFVPAASLVARTQPPDAAPQPRVARAARQELLSRREREVLELLCHGKQNKVIAAELQMQESTVKVHMRNLMRKFNAPNRLGVILAAKQFIGEPSQPTGDGAAAKKAELKLVSGTRQT